MYLINNNNFTIDVPEFSCIIPIKCQVKVPDSIAWEPIIGIDVSSVASSDPALSLYQSSLEEDILTIYPDYKTSTGTLLLVTDGDAVTAVKTSGTIQDTVATVASSFAESFGEIKCSSAYVPEGTLYKLIPETTIVTGDPVRYEQGIVVPVKEEHLGELVIVQLYNEDEDEFTKMHLHVVRNVEVVTPDPTDDNPDPEEETIVTIQLEIPVADSAADIKFQVLNDYIDIDTGAYKDFPVLLSGVMRSEGL